MHNRTSGGTHLMDLWRKLLGWLLCGLHVLSAGVWEPESTT